MPIKTRITELLGIQHPVIQGGMHYVGLAELASAVSNAGGLGILTGLTQKPPELLAREIARYRVMTEGDMDAGAWSCGMVAGLVHDIPTCPDLIDRIMGQAEQLLRGRLVGLLD